MALEPTLKIGRDDEEQIDLAIVENRAIDGFDRAVVGRQEADRKGIDFPRGLEMQGAEAALLLILAAIAVTFVRHGVLATLSAQ